MTNDKLKDGQLFVGLKAGGEILFMQRFMHLVVVLKIAKI